MNRDPINAEVVAAAAQAFFDTDIRLTEAVLSGASFAACVTEGNAAVATLAAVLLEQGVINSFEKVTEAFPEPNGTGLVQVTVEGLISPFCLTLAPQTGEVSVVA